MPHSARFAGLHRGPRALNCSGPGRQRRQAPGYASLRHLPGYILCAGASHRVRRHPREARLTPQAQAFSRERSQRYSRRARRDAATGELPSAAADISRAERKRGKGYAKGAFWFFLSPNKKNNQRQADFRHRADINSSGPYQSHCACGRRNVCAPHGPCQRLAEPITCRYVPDVLFVTSNKKYQKMPFM